MKRKGVEALSDLPPEPMPDWRPPPEPEPFAQRSGIDEELERRRQQRDDPAAQRRAFNPFTWNKK